MNKQIEKLIERLKEPDYKYHGCELCKSEADIVIPALEKQIVKKPLETGYREQCPNCKRFISMINSPTICGGCGQKLDRGNPYD